MTRAVRATAPALLLLLASAAAAQPGALPPAPEPASLRGDSTQTRKRLAEAEQKINAGKAADAADDLQRVLDESADDLIALDGRHYQTARWVAQGLLAKLPPDALRAYQDRIDQPAKKLLDRGKRDRDPRPLWQLLDRYFVSRPADEALLLLGDLLFERGEFRAAENTWRRLLPDAGADLVYPGSKADAALVRARVALAVIFQGEPARARAEVAAFEAKHATAAGTLAGRTGPLSQTLRAFAAAPPKLAADATGGAAWSTYGGAPDRAGRVPGGIPLAWPSRPAWQADIPAEKAPGGQPLLRFNLVNPPGRPPFGYPVVAGGEVFVSDGLRVLGFDLRSGAKTREYAASRLRIDGARAAEPAAALTAAGGLLYARVGASAVRPPALVAATGRLAPESVIVCLEPQDGERLREQWRLYPPEDEKTAAAWEGAPLVSGRRLWAVYARFEGGRTVHVAACYDPADAEKAAPPERPAWTTELCDSPLPVAGGERARQELLTLAGRHVVFCSNSGAVVAVDALTGRRGWGFRYPRSRKAVAGAAGDPAPAVAFGGRVFVAPADGERVYALDAETGKLVWESGPTEGARVLGVARGRLIVAVAGPLRGIRGLSLETGSHRDPEGWVQHAGDGILSYGQGFVTDDAIVWPSREGLFFLRPEDGRPLGDPLYGPGGEASRVYFGNLAYADGVLVVVTPTQVRGYAAQSRKVEPRPDPPPRERFDILVGRAERAAAAGDPGGARAVLAGVAGGDLPAPFRAWAAARMLQLSPPAREVAGLPAEVRDALRPPLLGEWLLPADGVPVTLDALLRRHLGHPPAPASAPGSAAPAAPSAHALAAGSEVVNEVFFPPAVAPLVPIPGAACPPKRLFAGGPRAVVAVTLDKGARGEHVAADLYTHAADVRDGFVAAGPFAVAVYGAAREPLWVFRVPVTDPLGGGAARFRVGCECEPAVPHLSSFVLAGPWLLARVGDYHLIALDLLAHRVAWVLNTGGRGGYEPAQFPTAVRFGPRFAVSGRFVVAQLSDGRRWFVELRTGRPVILPALGEHTARVFWPHPPAGAGENRLLISDGPGLVRLLRLDGRVRWAYELEHTDGLTGEPAQARAWGDSVLIAVRRNHGAEIDRVGAADGKAAWAEPAFADADRVDLSAADADAERAYVPAANRLLALALSDGKAAWEAELPDARGGGGWVVRAGKAGVIAYPAAAIPAEPPDVVWERLARSFGREPFVWRLPGLLGTLYDNYVARGVPVLLFDPETGKRLARFDVPARGPGVTAYFGADAAVIATGDRVVWLK